VRRTIRDRYPNQAVRPQVDSPDQGQGDIANIPIFPNRALPPQVDEHELEILTIIGESRFSLRTSIGITQDAARKGIDFDEVNRCLQTLTGRGYIDKMRGRKASKKNGLSLHGGENSCLRLRRNDLGMIVSGDSPIFEIFRYKRQDSFEVILENSSEGA
jgi:hypothetical protein